MSAGPIYTSPRPDLVIPDLPLSDLVLRHAGRLADKPAFIDALSGRALTFGQMQSFAQALAAGLRRLRIGKGDVVALFAPNLPDYPALFHGCLMAGAAVTTANPQSPAADLGKQLADSGAKLVITVAALATTAMEAARGIPVRVVTLDPCDLAEPLSAILVQDGIDPPDPIDPAVDLAALPYSSGTTGPAKGVMLTHRNLVANLCQMEAVDSTGEEDVLLGVLPLFHIYGMTAIANAALHRGATVVTLPRFEIETFLAAIETHRITRAYVAPPLVLLLARHPLVDRYDLGSLKVITSAAAPLSAELARTCAARLNCVVTQGYGLTETSPAILVDSDQAAAVTPGTVGRLVPNTEARLVDDSGRDVAPGESGELWVRGPQVMRGYLNRPAETAAMLDAEGWLHTGDVARVDANGRFTIEDRIKDLIKHKGFQVSPTEIEEVLLAHPGVADVAVVASADDESGEVPKAFVVPRGKIDADTLITHVADRVAAYKRVREVEFVDAIPRSAAGKVLRRTLVERERSRLADRSAGQRLYDRITLDRRGEHVLMIGLDRPNKMNAFDPEMFWGLSEALTLYEDDPSLRCAVIHGHGRAFTIGLDLATAAPLAARGELRVKPGHVNPWRLAEGRACTKPVIGAVHGRCLTLGIELLCALDIRLAAEGTIFAQVEVNRGLFPFGGATLRLPRLLGWGDAMRWMLTGDDFDAREAHRIGLVQEVVPKEDLMARAEDLADRIAAQAPLAIQATLASSRLRDAAGEAAAAEQLMPEIMRLMATADFREGVQSFFERRAPTYIGK